MRPRQFGWGTIHTWRAQSYYPALGQIINQHFGESLVDEGLNYAVLSNDNGFLGTWGIARC